MTNVESCPACEAKVVTEQRGMDYICYCRGTSTYGVGCAAEFGETKQEAQKEFLKSIEIVML